MELTASKTASCTIAPYRAWANGFLPLAMAVLTEISFQSRTASASAAAEPSSRAAANIYRPRALFLGLACILFIVLPPNSQCFDRILGDFPSLAGRRQ